MARNLLCGECKATIAPLDSLVLAEFPPSQSHLAIDFEYPSAESFVKRTLDKIPNDATGRRGADRCPFELRCRACKFTVGKVTMVSYTELLCFKTEHVRFQIGRMTLDKAKKLKNIKDELIKHGVRVVAIVPTSTCCQPSRAEPFPLVYGDVSGLCERDACLLTRDAPRDYQAELFQQAMRGNSLVYLPTGSGKTLIAAMVISCMASLNPGKLVVFVVDKVPLAHQQYDYVRKQVPRLKVKVITGEPEQNAAQRDGRTIDQDLTAGKVDVLVLTHQILLNMLTTQNMRMSDISVLVIDEAHHCTKKHPYKEIMDMYNDTADVRHKPLVLALTASPAGEQTAERSIEKLQELLSNLCGASLLRPTQLLDWKCPEFLCQPVALTSKQMCLRYRIQAYVEHLVPLVEKFANSAGALQGLNVFSTNFRGALWKILDQHHRLKFKKAQALGEHIIHVVTSHEISSILGFEFALQSLNDCLSRLEFAASPMERAKKAAVKTLGSYQRLCEFVHREHSEGTSSSPSSGRFRHLEHEIKAFASQVQVDESSRGIVFVKMRKTAYDLCEQLKKIPAVSENLHPTYFVGHGQGSDGMDWQGEQKEVLRKFRSGRIKLLISTNVLEEGIDVPICNLVVRFDSALTLRSLVQSRGRASRRADSKFIIICDEEERKNLQDAMTMERNMEDAVAIVHQRSASPPLQADLFGCERKKPDLSRLRVSRGASTEECPHDERISETGKYTPRIKVTVHNVATGEGRNKVTRFLCEHFEVNSLKASEDNRKMHFELEARTDSKECRSKDTFYDVVTETWCRSLNPREADPDRFWLQRNEPHSGKRRETPELLLSAECLSIGYFVHQTHFCRQWPATNCLGRVRASFEHDLRIFTVKFTATSEEGERQRYKAEILYSELEDFVLVDRRLPEASVDLFISLRRPPRLFREENIMDEDGAETDSDDSAFEDSSSDSEYDTDDEFPDVGQSRQSSHPEIPDGSVRYQRVSKVGDSTEDWGECLVYHLVLDPGSWVRVSKLLASLGRFNKKVHFAAVKVQQRSLPVVRVPQALPFDVHYSVKCLLSSHPVVRGRVSDRFGELLASNPDKAVAAIEKLNGLLERDKFCDPESELELLLNQTTLKPSGLSSQLLPKHCAAVKRVVITPTRTLFYPPEVMSKNRVLRNYDPRRFLCVNIRDEDFSKLSSAAGAIDPVLQRLKGILDQGIDFSGREFQYLGSSNSQLRSHGCWFVEQDLHPNEIRRWMGDFSRIRCVATFVARMGQCFSTSMDAVGIEVDQEASWTEKADVKSDDGKYCFSDGVGTISRALSREVVTRIGKDFVPSAYQIRFAGYKGVLTEDPSLQGKKACFRESMRKFVSPHRRLEVLQTSRPQVVYLNHQVIMLLSNLGVPDTVFLELQTAALDCLSDMLVSERRAVQQMTSAARTGIAYVKLSEGGLSLIVEPFFKSLLVAVYRERFHNLLSRARIQLPPKEARLMLGVMDETGVLEQGQVFVQYSAVSDDPEKDFNRNDKRVLTGRVVVGRNPCLHPGDFKTLKAVDKPQLRHLVDCVVFPCRGTRPHPNEMAGGDLDGDLYFVCWYKGLLPRKPDYPPMEYDALEAKKEPGEITVHHMTKHFVDYIRFDQLGVIDNAHKALADKLEDGIESERCLQLAECHSHAVDAPKTGKWPKLPQDCSVKEFPDFMMKQDKPAYPSEKILGRLYRKCRAFQEKSTEVIKPGSIRKPPLDKDLLVEGYTRFKGNAKQIYEEYREQIETLMNLYGVESEAELMTGSFLKLRNRLGKEKNEISQLLAQVLSQIRLKFRAEFFKEFGLDATRRKPEEVTLSAMQQKASAWYFVAYKCEFGVDPSWVHVRRLLGFPWLVDDVILGIKRGRKSTEHAPRPHAQVAAQVGESLAVFYREEKASLLDDYKLRVRTKKRFSRRLGANFPEHTVSMVGSSATLLSQRDSTLHLCVLPSCLVEEAVNPDKQHQRRLLENASSTVEEVFENHTLRGTGSSPVLRCTRPREASGYPKGLVLEMSASWQCLMKTALVSNYIKTYPDLLPLLRLVHRLGHHTTCSREESEVHSNALVVLMLVFCAVERKIRSPNFEEVQIECVKTANGEVSDGRALQEWENVTCCLDSRSPGPNYATLGGVLLSFLQNYGSLLERPFPEPFASIPSVRSAAALLTKEQQGLSREQVLQVFHFLALYSDVEVVLALCGSDAHRVVFLSPALSCTMRGQERRNARILSRKTGARVTIRPKPSAMGFCLILEARGSPAALSTVEREVEGLSVRAARDKVSLMSLCFVQGASLMLFEGSHSDGDHVTLEPYWGDNHQTHDYLEPHVPILKAPAREPSSCRNFRLFKHKFLTQLAVVNQDFDPEIHGQLEFAVHFGRVYVFSVPKSFIWDPCPVTVAMLRSNLRRKTRDQVRHLQRNRTVQFHDDNATPRRSPARRRRTQPKEDKKKKKREKPCRSSFFTVVHSRERTAEFLTNRLHNWGFTQVPEERRETYSVTFKKESQFCTQLNGNFTFREVTFPSLRWCVTDVKRKYQENSQGEYDDGVEVDVRFLLQSRRSLSHNEISGTEYEKYQEPLQADRRNIFVVRQRFAVKEEVWEDVSIIRHKKTVVFRPQTARRPSLCDMAVFFSDVTEYSRPAPQQSQFRKQFLRHEVKFKPKLPDDCSDREAMEGFLRDIWEFAFEFSSFMYQYDKKLR